MVTSVMPTYGRIDIAFERGEGPYLFTTEGERYLDFATGIAVNALGHSHPRLVAALKAQTERLWHVSNLYNIPEQMKLADTLVANSFADTVFFCNSGAEALEGALKVARKHQYVEGDEKREGIIACTSSFHGRTLATLSAGDNEAYRTGFGPRPSGFTHVAFGNLNEMRNAISDETAAILVEPVQGEGGINPASAEYLQGLRATAEEYGLLLIFDEVQCGVGRTGKLWAHEHANVAPDIMALAKGMGGGFPVGAVMATEKAASGMVPGTHGSTFGGNPLAAAAANAVLEVILEDGFLGHVNEMAAYLQGKLDELVAKHPTVVNSWRGSGLMLGVKCEVKNLDMMTKLREANMLTVVAGDNVIRLLPPLNIERAHADEAMAIFDKVCAGWKA